MIRRLSRCIREYKWAALLSPLCMVGEVAMEVLIPLVMADLYDYGIKLQDMQVVAAKSGILVLCALASLAFGVLSAAFASKAGTGFAKNLRHDMYHQVQDFSFSNIDKFSTASIVTRLTSDLKYLFKVMIPICRPTVVTITILKVIECWNAYVWPRLITDDQSYFLVSNGIQEIRENGFGRENIPAMMAAVVAISMPLIVLFLIFRKKIMEGVSRGGVKG